MYKKLLYLFILIVLIGCKEKLTKVVKYYDNGSIERIYFLDSDSVKQGEVKIYFSNNRIKLKGKYRDGSFSDTIYHYRDEDKNIVETQNYYFNNGTYLYKDFYINGKIKQEGLSNKNDQRIGLWKNYDKDGNHHFTKEYKIIDGKEHVNQMWVTLPTGDTLTEGASIRYHFDKNKLQLTDSIYAFFQTDVSSFVLEDQEKTTVSVVLPKDYTQANFVPDFSNQPKDPDEKDGIPIIKIKSLKEHPNPMAVLQNPIDTTNYKKTVAFYWKPKRAGKDTIRGYFKEKLTLVDESKPIQLDKDQDSIITSYTKQIFFEFPVEVTKD
ncbi:toxin-antitoxin system YwqK family antitoxin [Aquimarina muelleri]|uniref:toxin-antitoxin system YwqK family antitoxin n=1 Tax=Aquimarina muelleri TaxID=279356 RepID=UPI003F686AD7